MSLHSSNIKEKNTQKFVPNPSLINNAIFNMNSWHLYLQETALTLGPIVKQFVHLSTNFLKILNLQVS